MCLFIEALNRVTAKSPGITDSIKALCNEGAAMGTAITTEIPPIKKHTAWGKKLGKFLGQRLRR